MYLPNFEYRRASSISEAISLLKDNQGAKLLAGGHSLLPMMKLRQAAPPMLIDIGRIEALKGINRTNGTFRIGALSTHSMIAEASDLPSALVEAAGNVGDLQVRNRGTIGGNVSHADPASDHPTVLTALGANLIATGPSGERKMAATEFFMALFTTALREDEVLTVIEVPAHRRGMGSAYAKMVHPASGYSVLGAAATLTMADGRCTSAGVAIGGLTAKATRVPSVETALTGKILDESTLARASEAVLDDLNDDLMGDSYASAEYRRSMAPIYVLRALKSASERARM